MARLYRYQSTARRDLRSGQRIQYRHGRYSLVPAPGFAGPNSFAAGLPAYTAPNPEVIMGQARTQAQEIADPLLRRIMEKAREEEANARMESERETQKTIAQYEAARQPIHDLYQRYITGATAVEESVANRLKGIGDQRTEDLAAKLNQIGMPAGSTTLPGAKQAYQGQQAADFASGMSDVGSLQRRGAEQEAWLQRAPGLARQEAEQTLADTIRDISQRSGSEAADLRANIPGQVRELYESLFGQAEGKAKSQYESNWQQITYLQEQKKAAQEARIVAREMGDKKAEAAAKAQEKELDRQLKRELAQYNQGQQTARTEYTQQQQNARTAAQIEARQGKGKGGRSAAQQRLRENEANKQINNLLFAKDKGGRMTQQPSQWALKATDAQVNQRINAILTQNGINPNSATGRRLRKAAWARYGTRTGKRGNPVR